MVALTAARCVEFADYNGDVYPGFMTFSGGYDTVSQSGLVIFNATVEICHHPDNPQSLDTRENFSTWAWCREVKFKVADDNGVMVIPKCLPKLYIKSAKYDPVNERLRLELTDTLGIREVITIDDFKEDFDDENVIDDGEPERLQACGNPEDEDYNSELAEEQENKKKKYWWEQWEYEGWADNNEIIKEILTRLNISSTGSVSGQVKCPFTISGSLIGVCGDLAFKSLTPSYLWADWKGIVHIERIKIDQPRKYSYSVPVDLAGFDSVGIGNLISELVVTGRIPELEEDEDNDVVQNEDSRIFKTETIQEIPTSTFSSSSEGVDNFRNTMIGSRLLVTEEIKNYKKIIKSQLEIRYGLLFPDSQRTDPAETTFVIGEASEEIQYFDSCTGRLKKIRKRLWEPWGKVFGGFYSNYGTSTSEGGVGGFFPPEDFIGEFDSAPDFPGMPFGTASRYSPSNVSRLSFYAETDPALILSKEDVSIYKYNETTGKVKSIETVTTEPKMKIIKSFFPPQSGYSVTGKSIEEWKSWGANHHIHIQSNMRSFEDLHGDLIEKRESVLVDGYFDTFLEQNPGFVGSITQPVSKIPGYVLNAVKKDAKGKILSYTMTVSSPSVDTDFRVPYKFVRPEARLALTTGETKTEHSRGGTANAPNPEYLPHFGRSESESQSQSEKWKYKPIHWRKKWDGRQYWDCTPARETIDLGEVYSENVLDKVGSVIFALRQAQAQTYQITMPVYENWLTDSNFKPCARFDVGECWDKEFAYFGNGYGFEFGRTEALMLVELWFLGTGSATAPEYTPPALDAFLIDFVPDPNHGVFYIGSGGPAVYVGQSLTQSQIEQLVFSPGANFTGATTLNYTAQASDGQSSPTPVSIAVVDPTIDPVTIPNDTQLSAGGQTYPVLKNNTGQVGVVVNDSVQYVTPSVTYSIQTGMTEISTAGDTSLEGNGIVYAPSGFIDMPVQEKSVLRRLELTPEERLSIEQDTRVVSLYR